MNKPGKLCDQYYELLVKARTPEVLAACMTQCAYKKGILPVEFWLLINECIKAGENND